MFFASDVFFPASKPRQTWLTVASAFTDCESTTAALGSSLRPSAQRTASRSRSCSSVTNPVSRRRVKNAYTRGQGGKSDGMARHLMPLSTR
ncbi:hypothetical protein DKG34_10110 [Streptomyces sp. NWU49]|nr:hypothetical protein DKG34_10110 [Streptomyces sp. NWU49]